MDSEPDLDPETELSEKSDPDRDPEPDPEIIFSAPTHCFLINF